MILEAEHISHSFGPQPVLNDVSFTLDRGEALALLGGNGAGKTTLLRIVTLLLAPDSGTVRFDGHPMSQDDLRHVGYLPEERGLYRHMKAREQALFFARLKGLGRRQAAEAADRWFARLGMQDWACRPAASLSKGMQQRLQLAVSVLHDPWLLILDEPFSGLDADNAALLRAEMARLRDHGTAIILSTHNRQAANELCTKTLQL